MCIFQKWQSGFLLEEDGGIRGRRWGTKLKDVRHIFNLGGWV